jgi:hypothetical protein
LISEDRKKDTQEILGLEEGFKMIDNSISSCQWKIGDAGFPTERLQGRWQRDDVSNGDCAET